MSAFTHTTPAGPALGRDGHLAGAGSIPESWLAQGVGLVLALVITGLFWTLVSTYLVEAHGGVDQNGYLTGGRMLWQTPGQGYQPRVPGTHDTDYYAFVGKMWVGVHMGTPQETYFPKYPLGVPALVALLMMIGGLHQGVAWAFWISPVGMTLGVLGTYFLARPIVGVFLALLATAVLACNTVVLQLAVNPNSHGATFGFVVWGMVLLMSWHRKGGYGRAILAGLLLGYALTIRYTEGLLLLPTLAAAWTQRRRSWGQAGALLAAWAVPGTILVAYNLRAMGAITGYDPTGESTGFAWDYFRDNWPTMLGQMQTDGLPLLFSLGLAGILLMGVRRRGQALLLALWVIPPTLVYTAYYWAPDGPRTLGYLRFFVSIFPGLTVAGLWLFSRALWTGTEAAAPAPAAPLPRHAGRWLLPLSAGVFSALACAIALVPTLPLLVSDQVERLTLLPARDVVWEHVPTGSAVFCSDTRLLHYLQFTAANTYYSPDMFSFNYVSRLRPQEETDEPQPWQPQRQQELLDHYRALHLLGGPPPVPANLQGRESERARRDLERQYQNEQQAILDREQEQTIRHWLDAGRRVFVIALVSQEWMRNNLVKAPDLMLSRGGQPLATLQNTWPNDDEAVDQPPWHGRRPMRRLPPRPPQVDLKRTFFGLYEVVAKPAPASQPAPPHQP